MDRPESHQHQPDRQSISFAAHAQPRTKTALSVGVVHQINASPGGVPKLPVAEAQVTKRGLLGDRQRNTRVHGGPRRAVCLFSLEVIEALRDEGHPIVPGAAGENLTISGIDWSLVQPGARLRLGEQVALEITRYTSPCKNIAASFKDSDFARIAEERFPGQSRVYARVFTPGLLRTGDTAELL